MFLATVSSTDIAKTYGSGLTKTNVLVETLASDDSNYIYIAIQMQNQRFSLATDGSDDC